MSGVVLDHDSSQIKGQSKGWRDRFQFVFMVGRARSVISIFLQKHRLSERTSKIIASITIGIIGFFIGVMGLAFILAGEIYEYQDSVDGVHLPLVDSIVCLAGGRGRIAGAADIWYRYRDTVQNPAPILYLSGMGPQSTWNVFIKQIREGVKNVIRPEEVVLETESFNTEANARWLIRYARQKGWDRVLLVTSPYHMKRARYIFERIAAVSGATTAGYNGPIAFETLSIFQEPFESGEWRTSFIGIRVTMVEYFKWVYYRFFWNP